MERKTNNGDSSADVSYLKPFIKTLKNKGEKYSEILTSGNASKMRSGFVTLQPGDEIGEHSTDNHEEIIIVLTGNGTIQASGMETKTIGAGQIAYNPPHTRHNVKNSGNIEMMYIFVVSKA